ncbi:ATP-dependent RNA helicase DbpA [Bdellovibrio sp. HCB337]|uniref:ATP-dependent RNA helicase DbpA n=1 Tax=Bdellovibrio sp. HCB337 TaxID=3394358 RepID=UPI0039A6D858
MKQTDFASLSLSQDLLTVVGELGFQTMTSIQAEGIPVLLSGKDLIGQSKTGSGKTATFALPILEKIQIRDRGLQAVILCPTRELVVQVVGEIRKLGRRLEGLQVLPLVGGQPGREQAAVLENGVHIAVGTTGRVLDHLQRGRMDLSPLKTLVLDEADKMLEMGFEEELKAIMKFVPAVRQTVLFSATFPESIQDLSRRFQKNPVKLVIEEPEEAKALIEQLVYETEPEDKLNVLMRVLQQHPAESTIVFCNTKAAVSAIAEKIAAQNVSCAALHGDLEQRERERVMALFRNGSHRILVATDVAARGLDIENLELVVNFDLPQQPEVYVHRIGRTGRAGKTGTAVSLASPREALRIVELERFVKAKFVKPSLGFKNQHGLGKSQRESRMQTLSISGGRKDKLRPGDILGALTGESGGLSSSDVGKIEIHDHFAYVAISATVAQQAFDQLREGRIKGKKFQIKFVK